MAKPKPTAADTDIKWKGAPPPPSWTTIGQLAGTEFNHKLEHYRELVGEIKSLEQQKKELGVEIEALLLVSGKKSLAAGDLFAVSCNGRTAGSLSKQLLLEQGVDAAVIEDAWVPGNSYTYVQVKKLGEKDSE